MNKIWICAIAKMEELYIQEWIEWHKKIGVDHIIIGDNNDSNYEIPLQPIIQSYIDSGYIELVNLNDKLGYQQTFYAEIYQNRKEEFDWIGFIDIDEFVEIKKQTNIKDFLNQSIFQNTDSILFCWKNYGDSGKIHYEPKPVKERFTKPTKFSYFNGIKYFIRGHLNEVIQLYSIHEPELGNFQEGYKIKVCDVLGNFNFTKKIREGKGDSYYTQIFINKEYYQTAYLSHYVTKSTEEYIKYKSLRGRCDRKVNNYEPRYTGQHYFVYNNKTPEKIKLFKEYYTQIKEFKEIQLNKYNS